MDGYFSLKDSKNEDYMCSNACTDSFLLLTMVNDAEAICERGCRLFNIIYLTDGHDINTTKQQCYLSCKEAYLDTQNRMVCITGCNTMDNLMNVYAFMKQDNSRNLFSESDIEVFETDLFSDPIIKTHLQLGYSFRYKIPETRVKTMPILEIMEQRILESKSQFPGNWLDCASRNSGIPKIVLLVALSFASITALFLLISSIRYRDTAQFPFSMEHTDQCYDAKINYTEKMNLDSKKKETEELVALAENEIYFSKPPLYEVDNEKA
ncbi:transmembrane protein 59-like protein [Holotrichia oblita]|uniref:Transmembrane protein 59-like protein n=1 Tax=Holotrichia oblita TaxID=644536 RepID=A0ACB9T3P5_HOLOL|nr:transmembrane protein 59-like protein [Holotrichia oblita]